MVKLRAGGGIGEGVEGTSMRGLSLLPCMSNECLYRDERDNNVEPSLS